MQRNDDRLHLLSFAALVVGIAVLVCAAVGFLAFSLAPDKYLAIVITMSTVSGFGVVILIYFGMLHPGRIVHRQEAQRLGIK